MSLFRNTRKEIGDRGEKIAARYLKKQGFKILCRNLHCGKNELDLVAKNKEYLLFVEVKTRTYVSEADAIDHPPSLAVDQEKRRKTIEAARFYLREHPTSLCPRMDVIEISLDRITRKILSIHHFKGAFDAHGRIL